MKYRRYPAYKESGIEWLGEVPAHWEVSQFSRCLERIETGWTPDSVQRLADEDEWAVLKVGCIRGGKFYEEEHKALALGVSAPPELEVRPRDLLMSRANTLELVGSIGLVRKTRPYLTLSDKTFRLVLQPQLLPEYANYLLQGRCARVQIELGANGASASMKNIGQEVVRRLVIPTPSVTEQVGLVTFLDHETAHIDDLITKQERLITVLQEKRQALISHAVTKGLNPDASMKDSGVAWLGEVPAHWGVKRLKHIADIQTGVAKGRDLSGQDTIHLPYMRVANVQDGYLDLADVATIEIARSELERYRLQAGDVLMNEGGDNDKLGRGHIWRAEIDPCIHQNHVFAVRPHGVEPEWLTLVTGADYAKFYFFSFAKQSTNLASISSSNLRELPVMCPPLPERNEIRLHVAAESVKIDTLIEMAEMAIGKLQERRSTLISAAVTGKIDVRDIG